MSVRYDDKGKFVQPSRFIIRPDKTVEVACYSSGPVGRLAADHVLNLVKYYRSLKKS